MCALPNYANLKKHKQHCRKEVAENAMIKFELDKIKPK